MRTIRVVAAVIAKRPADGSLKILATQRGYGEFKDGWEFPGGKIESGETPEQALHREIREELNAEIKIEFPIHTIEYDYPQFHLSMDCFWCTPMDDAFELKEHEAAKWLARSELHSVDWLPADTSLIDILDSVLQSKEQ